MPTINPITNPMINPIKQVMSGNCAPVISEQ